MSDHDEARPEEPLREEGDAEEVEPEAEQPEAEQPEAGEAPAEEDPRGREELLEALVVAERERDEFLDDLKRAQAEFANYRKRSMREGAEQRQQGQLEVLGQLVDVVDDFELAVLAAESSRDVESLRRGVEMVYGKLVDILRSFGMEKIGQVGVPFDPERHDAVQQVSAEDVGEVETDEEGPVVVEVLRPGYMVGDRVLRAAMVKVRT